MTRIKSTYLAVLAVLLSPMAANADPVFENGDFNGVNGYFSDSGHPQYVADNFGFAGDTTVGGMSFYGGWFPQNSPGGVFELVFYSDAAGIPGAQVGSYNIFDSVTATDTGIDAFGTDVYLFDLVFNTNPLAFLGGGDYWVSVFTDAQNSDIWYWGTSDGHPDYSGLAAFSFDQSNWNAFEVDLAFSLQAAESVPEPGTLALLGLGLAGIGFARRKKV